jgi:predicted RNA binding protein YcfA (HicA-like mRNA interferase family)
LQLRRADDGRVVIVPLHRELATGTLASILRQAGMDRAELQVHLNGG